MAATAAMESSSATTEAASSVETAKAGLSTECVALGDPAMREPTEGSGMYSRRSVGHIRRVSRLTPAVSAVSIPAVIEVGVTALEMIPIDNGCTVRNIRVVVVLNPAVVMPVIIPVRPSPPVACE